MKVSDAIEALEVASQRSATYDDIVSYLKRASAGEFEIPCESGVVGSAVLKSVMLEVGVLSKRRDALRSSLLSLEVPDGKTVSEAGG